MNVPEISVVGLALAVDATVYSFSYGLLLQEKRVISAFMLALVVGCFQAMMPLAGYVGGASLHEIAATWDHWIVLIVFAALGGSIIRHAWSGTEESEFPIRPLGFSGLLMVGLATSIDALAVGACMALGNVGGAIRNAATLCQAVGLIGLITFICSLAAFHAARMLHKIPTRWLETGAGLILIGLGVQNFIMDITE